ncbi:hypothetical protein F7725_004617 [Dissostichus mawsoni]|uniref:Dehydrogenase/reductase SDR family member 4 n=1 Tax=Dissostichus mawsoni TaxID=36200 RepID=A0A7J5XJZ0_DISMA|nr:hypothetical protein F7725_004617 [Dissostichus mawsoni]
MRLFPLATKMRGGWFPCTLLKSTSMASARQERRRALSSRERWTSVSSPSEGGALPMADSAGRRSDRRAHVCWKGGGGSSERHAFQVERISASEVARSRDDSVEAELSTEWTRLESVTLHCMSPDPLLETERRRVEVDEDDREHVVDATVGLTRVPVLIAAAGSFLRAGDTVDLSYVVSRVTEGGVSRAQRDTRKRGDTVDIVINFIRLEVRDIQSDGGDIIDLQNPLAMGDSGGVIDPIIVLIPNGRWDLTLPPAAGRGRVYPWLQLGWVKLPLAKVWEMLGQGIMEMGADGPKLWLESCGGMLQQRWAFGTSQGERGRPPIPKSQSGLGRVPELDCERGRPASTLRSSPGLGAATRPSPAHGGERYTPSKSSALLLTAERASGGTGESGASTGIRARWWGGLEETEAVGRDNALSAMQRAEPPTRPTTLLLFKNHQYVALPESQLLRALCRVVKQRLCQNPGLLPRKTLNVARIVGSKVQAVNFDTLLRNSSTVQVHIQYCMNRRVMLRSVFRCLRTNPVSYQRNMSQSSLAGKVAIVTASTDGIGLAAAQALGKRGAHVVVSSRRQANVDKAVTLLQSQSITVTGTTCNVGKEEDREKLVQLTLDQCGGIDILVSNAAVNPFFGNIMDSTEEVWDKILSVNVTSAFLMTKLVVPHMTKRGGGNVVFVSSVAGYQPMQALGPYSVSKTALLGLTRALAPELAQMGEPEEIGGVIAFLCSEDASYITGETITVTGGIGCRL